MTLREMLISIPETTTVVVAFLNFMESYDSPEEAYIELPDMVLEKTIRKRYSLKGWEKVVLY